MSSEKTGQLILKLRSQTSSGQVRWKESAEENVFKLSFPKFTLQIRIGTNFNGAETIYMDIFNEEGALIETVSDDDMKGWLDKPYILMKDIYQCARRQAMGVEDALDHILGELDGASPF